MTTVVGLSGWARVGKDSAGKALSPYGFERVSFADKLRDVAYLSDPWIDQADMYLADLIDAVGWENGKSFPEVRQFLQHLGTSVRDILGQNVWVNAALEPLRLGGSYAITDVRFWNEADAIQALGGKVIRIERPGYRPVNDHISEVGLDNYPFDATITNDGSIDELGRQIMEVLNVVAQ